MDTDNLTKQIDEIEALRSIYEDDFTTESEANRSYTIRVAENKNEVLLTVRMPPEYPGQAPPQFEISAPWMDRKMKGDLLRGLDEVYLENIGESVVYQCVERIRELLLSVKPPEVEKKKQTSPLEETLDLSQLEISCPEITHGEVIIDRKSSFQGHAAEVHSLEDVNAVLAKLKQNKKIMNATHNMYAYRIEKKTAKGVTVLQDCDDDGEAHAGGRMLHLLQILDQKNTLVVVSRCAVLAKLKQNKKIMNATHNMYAYRIEKKTAKGVTVLQDCDDDGEAHAGGRMLHLLQILDQKNTLVVVSRWYGGIQLGPDRFRHINNATRQVIQQAGLLKK